MNEVRVMVKEVKKRCNYGYNVGEEMKLKEESGWEGKICSVAFSNINNAVSIMKIRKIKRRFVGCPEDTVVFEVKF